MPPRVLVVVNNTRAVVYEPPCLTKTLGISEVEVVTEYLQTTWPTADQIVRRAQDHMACAIVIGAQVDRHELARLAEPRFANVPVFIPQLQYTGGYNRVSGYTQLTPDAWMYYV